MTAVAEPETPPRPQPAEPESGPLWDLGAEQYVIGAMLQDPSMISAVQQVITDPGMFWHIPNRIVFNTLADLAAAKKPTDVRSVLAHISATDAGSLRKLDNGIALTDAMTAAPITASGTYYARIVADRAVIRSLDQACAAIRTRIRAGAGTAADLLEQTRLMIADLAGRVAATDGPVLWRDIIEPATTELEAIQNGESAEEAIPTGFPDLDRLIRGLIPGQVYAVAGLSGSGKSTFVGDLVRSAAFTHQQPTVVFNMEMSRNELFAKLVCGHAGVEHSRLGNGTMTDQDWIQIAKVCGETEDAPLWIDDTPSETVADICVKSHRLHQQHGPLKVIVVDLIGLVTAPEGQTREQQVAAVSRRLKVLAGELGAAVIVVAQLNRGPNQRTDKRPNQHDLRESAQIGHDASGVILLHRPEQYDPTSHVGEAILIVDKNRFGPTGDVPVAAQLHKSRFQSMALPSEYQR